MKYDIYQGLSVSVVSTPCVCRWLVVTSKSSHAWDIPICKLHHRFIYRVSTHTILHHIERFMEVVEIDIITVQVPNPPPSIGPQNIQPPRRDSQAVDPRSTGRPRRPGPPGRSRRGRGRRSDHEAWEKILVRIDMTTIRSYMDKYIYIYIRIYGDI